MYASERHLPRKDQGTIAQVGLLCFPCPLITVYIPRGGRFWPEARKRPLDREEAFRQ
jgi:hypothetical protein